MTDCGLVAIVFVELAILVLLLGYLVYRLVRYGPQ